MSSNHAREENRESQSPAHSEGDLFRRRFLVQLLSELTLMSSALSSVHFFSEQELFERLSRIHAMRAGSEAYRMSQEMSEALNQIEVELFFKIENLRASSQSLESRPHAAFIFQMLERIIRVFEIIDQILDLEIRARDSLLVLRELHQAQYAALRSNHFEGLNFEFWNSIQELVFPMHLISSTWIRKIEEIDQAVVKNLSDSPHELDLRIQNFLDVLKHVTLVWAQTAGKAVELQILNVHSHSDLRVLESLSSVFFQLIRNSIEHGLEDSSERVLLKKPRVAKIEIKLEAQNKEGREVYYSDDGRGLVPEKLLEDAEKKGILSEVEVSGQSASGLNNLIFLPGLTTRPSSRSKKYGFGVGMTFVQKELHHMGGMIEVVSRPGCGVQFRIRLPF
jgi:chemotaxis protein histidine kinase CheA